MVNNIAQYDISGSTWSALGGGLNGVVNAIRVSSTTIFVCGSFTTATNADGDVVVKNIAQYNTSTKLWSAVGGGLDGQVNSLIINSGILYVGGNFTTATNANGDVVVNNIAQYNISNSTWSALGGGVNGIVKSLTTNAGILYAGGNFTAATNANGDAVVKNIAQYNIGTKIWSALGGVGGGLNGVIVNSIAVNSGTTLYVGGNFTAATNANGDVVVNNIAKYTISNSTWSALGGGLNGNVNSIAIDTGILYAGGNFTNVINVINGVNTPVNVKNIAQYTISNSTWLPLGGDLNSNVNLITIDTGMIYAGGSFSIATNANGDVPVNNLAKYNILNASWSAIGNKVIPIVKPLTFDLSGVLLYTGGSFTTAININNGVNTPVPVNNIATYDISGSTWSALGGGLNGNVNSIRVSQGTIYAGGSFITANNVINGVNTLVNVNNIAQYDISGSTWSALGGGLNGNVNSIRILSSTTIFVGGSFTTAINVSNGVNTLVPVKNIAQYNTSTKLWSAVGGVGVGLDGQVNTLQTDSGILYVGGNFLNVTGVSPLIVVKNIAQYDTGTKIWSALGGGVDRIVKSIAVNAGILYAGGNFTTATNASGDIVVKNIAQYNISNSTWSALGGVGGVGGGLNGIVNSISVNAGILVAGGNFTAATNASGDVAVNNIAQYDTTSKLWLTLGGGLNGIINSVSINSTTSTSTIINLFVDGNFTKFINPDTLLNYIAQITYNPYFDYTTKTMSVSVNNKFMANMPYDSVINVNVTNSSIPYTNGFC